MKSIYFGALSRRPVRAKSRQARARYIHDTPPVERMLKRVLSSKGTALVRHLYGRPRRRRRALEGLQALTSDRSSNLLVAFYGASGALAAALLAELFIRARKRRAG